jgi:hypothetical protein
MKIKFVLLLFAALIFLSCSHSYKTNSRTGLPCFNLDSIVGLAVDTCYSKLYHDVFLKSENNTFISSMDQVRMFKDNFYVLDKRQKMIFKFSNAGDLISKIGKVGRGPGEYTFVMDFFLKDNRIYVLDIQQRIFIYDLDGKFLELINLPFQANYFENLGSSKIVFQDLIYDGVLSSILGVYCLEAEKIIHSLNAEKGINDDDYPFMRLKHLWMSSEGVYFNYDYSNDVYKLTDDGIIPVFSFQSSKFPSIDEIKYYNNNPTLRQQDAGKRLFSIKGVFQHNKDLISFYVMLDYSLVRVFYSQNTGEINVFQDCALNICHENDGVLVSYRFPGFANAKRESELDNPVIRLHQLAN